MAFSNINHLIQMGTHPFLETCISLGEWSTNLIKKEGDIQGRFDFRCWTQWHKCGNMLMNHKPWLVDQQVLGTYTSCQEEKSKGAKPIHNFTVLGSHWSTLHISSSLGFEKNAEIHLAGRTRFIYQRDESPEEMHSNWRFLSGVQSKLPEGFPISSNL